MPRTKTPATVAVFPALMTLGKLVRGKGPVEVLKEMDAMENKHGKKAMFNGKKILDKVRAGATIPYCVADHTNTFRGLEEKGLIESHPDNRFLPNAERKYRLTPTSRAALKYI